MEKNIDLYNAQQALDEIAVIEQRLQAQRSRLEQDAKNVANRTASAQQAIQIGSGERQHSEGPLSQRQQPLQTARYNPTEEEEDNYLGEERLVRHPGLSR